MQQNNQDLPQETTENKQTVEQEFQQIVEVFKTKKPKHRRWLISFISDILELLKKIDRQLNKNEKGGAK